MSGTALDGFVPGDVEKAYLFDLIKKLSAVYFAEVLGFCIMGNRMPGPISQDSLLESYHVSTKVRRLS